MKNCHFVQICKVMVYPTHSQNEMLPLSGWTSNQPITIFGIPFLGANTSMMAALSCHAWTGPIAISLVILRVNDRGPSFQNS